jgi:hypothetical protein
MYQLLWPADGPGASRKAQGGPALVEEVALFAEQFGKQRPPDDAIKRLCREDLELICFEYVSG